MPPQPGESVSPPEIHSYENLTALSEAAAREIVGDARETVDRGNEYTIALAGGSTPQPLYELLAGEEGKRMPWEKTHLFWGDERFVPHDHPASNYRLVEESLLEEIELTEGQVHPIPTDVESPERAAEIYEAMLRDFFSYRDRELTFDLVLLGLGEDGHTASLFPEDRPHEKPDEDTWVRGVRAPDRHRPRERVTLTLSALGTAWDVFFLVAGANKREAFHRVTQEEDPELPATHVRPRRRLVWLVDQAANPSGIV